MAKETKRSDGGLASRSLCSARRVLIGAIALLAPLTPASAADCRELLALKMTTVTVQAAETVKAGDLQQRSDPDSSTTTTDSPAYCRMRAVIRPVPGSSIGFELWMPEAGWNGRFKMFGNGGYSSTLPLAALANGLRSGYAVAGTDTGHQGDDPEFAKDAPESIVDWGNRAVHLTAVNAKAIVRTFYGKPPVHAYFEGCSTGGHQALMSAQRYPSDFDGIIAGAPGNNRTRLNIGFLWQFVVNRRLPSSDQILPAAKLPTLTKAALDQCGTPEERARGYLENPFLCRVDPAKLQCSGEDSATCLTGEQVAVVAKMYAGARNPRTGAQIYPPWLPGSESGWSTYWADPRNPLQPARANFFRYWAFHDPDWDWRSFDFDRSLLGIDPGLGAKIDAIDPDLSAFARRGGKLILYHGLADPVVSPWDTRHYYDAMQLRAKNEAATFARLFFAPGMGHCAGGPGANLIDAQSALEDWVERGHAPRSLLAHKRGDPSVARRLCPYPAVGGACLAAAPGHT